MHGDPAQAGESWGWRRPLAERHPQGVNPGLVSLASEMLLGKDGTLPAAPDHNLRLTHTHTGGSEPSLHMHLLLAFLFQLLLLCSSFRIALLSCNSFTMQSAGSWCAVLLALIQINLREKCGAVPCVLRSPLPLLGFLGAAWQPWL